MVARMSPPINAIIPNMMTAYTGRFNIVSIFLPPNFLCRIKSEHSLKRKTANQPDLHL